MGTNQDHDSGCPFPFGDDFLPILAFFFSINDPRHNAYTIQEDDLEDEDPEDEDQGGEDFKLKD